jgi:BirA family biotin operon repressor/biotin-[acetyl-CoA-carboxylase] ligase
MTLDAQILSALRDGTAVSGADLSQRFGVSRAAIWARIDEMRRLGYEISATPHKGYSLVKAPDLLHADDIIARLPARRIVGRDIKVFQETTSTNDVVEKMARDGVREGIVVFAESQTKGRGRLGRKWLSPSRKGLWFSVLLRPKLRPQDTTQLTATAANALLKGIRRHTGLDAGIKWPNDILVNGRKVAGILTELSAEADVVRHVVVGMGVDVNLAASDFPVDLRSLATSLQDELGRPLSRADLAVSILRELDIEYSRLMHGKFSEIAEEWEKNCITIGQRIEARMGSRIICGFAEAIGDDGALVVRTEHGRIERLTAGDVTIEKRGSA